MKKMSSNPIKKDKLSESLFEQSITIGANNVELSHRLKLM